jgi:serine/threonine-protein kinase HipA
MSDGADVYRSAEKVGRIARTPKGSRFEYEEAFYRSYSGRPGGIAAHLPYSRRSVETSGVNLHTFFAGLLPEGLRLRALVARTKTSEDDLLTLLVAAGADCVGDLSVAPEGRPPAETSPSVDVARIEDSVFADLLRRSLGYDAGRMEPSVPGVQEKISAFKVSFPLSGGRGPRAYLLKLNPSDKPSLVQNEEFFLRMGRACGLQVAAAKIVHDKTDAAGLLVERFDRVAGGSGGGLSGLHQEDACQLMDRYPADKYRISSAEIAEALSICSAPVVEVGRFIRLSAFSYLIGNGDLHAKNVSVLWAAAGEPVALSPAYDLLSTLPYGDDRMALKLDGRDDNLKRRTFVEFGQRFGVREPACRAILDEIVDASHEWIDRVEEIELPPKKIEHLRVVMRKRRQDLSA